MKDTQLPACQIIGAIKNKDALHGRVTSEYRYLAREGINATGILAGAVMDVKQLQPEAAERVSSKGDFNLACAHGNLQALPHYPMEIWSRRFSWRKFVKSEPASLNMALAIGRGIKRKINPPCSLGDAGWSLATPPMESWPG